MTTGDTLGLILAALDRAGVASMLAGSFASSLHGLARSTSDIDVVIDPTPSTLDRFLDLLDRERFYADDVAARRALGARDQFNVIDTATGWKVDLIVRKDRPFSVSEFERRQEATVLGIETAVATAEDTILAKLEWARLGGSGRQRQDVIEILRIRGHDLDHPYLDRWAVELGVLDDLAQVRRAADDL